MEERRALGKGLGSLLPIGNKAESSRTFMECPVKDILPNQNQPRKLFDKTAIDELAASIEEKGIIQPLIVRPLGGGKYELIAGERRFRAAQSIRMETVPVIVKDAEEKEVLEIAIIENIQRQDLNVVEEALAYKDLINRYQYTQDELAKRLGKDRSSIANTLRLLKLPEEIRAYLIAGKISMGHARAILSLDNPELQKNLADQIIYRKLSVREVEELIRAFKEDGVSFEMRVPKAGEKSGDDLEIVKSNSKQDPNKYKDLEEQLVKDLKAKIQIKPSGKSGGKMIIYFSSDEELNRLIEPLSLLDSVIS